MLSQRRTEGGVGTAWAAVAQRAGGCGNGGAEGRWSVRIRRPDPSISDILFVKPHQQAFILVDIPDLDKLKWKK